jgi:hypothetical protein
MKTEYVKHIIYVTSSFHGVKFALRYCIRINMKSPISVFYEYTSTVHLGKYMHV